MIPKLRIVVTTLLGLLLAIGSSILGLNQENIQRYIVQSLMVLKPNTFISSLWQNPNLDIHLKIFLFNWTNSEQFDNHSVKPNFQDVGPYAFTEKMQKLNVVWHEENSTVSYVRKSRFTFDEANSVGKLDDLIIAPNTLAAGLYSKIRYWNPMVRSMLDLGLKMYDNGVSLARSANDWLFNGFDTPLIKLSKMIPTSMVPELVFPYQRIGYGYPRNGSTDIYGHHNVYTGRDDFNKLGQVARWRYDNVSRSYPKCGQIKGSTGEFQRAPLKKGEPISYFLPDLCRDIHIDYAGTTTYEGMEAYIYKGSKKNMGNATDNPEHQCYCPDSCQEVPSGLLNISTCWYDVPVFASYPHFYAADEFYIDQIDGMKPDKERHEMTVILEPKTGMVLLIKARIQLNLLIEPFKHSSIYRHSRRTFIPLVWADYRVSLAPDLLYYLQLLPLSLIIGKICCYLCVAIGLLMLLWYPRKIFRQKQLMRKIEISSVEMRMQNSVMPENIKTCPEASPLLVGLQYVAAPREAAGRNS